MAGQDDRLDALERRADESEHVADVDRDVAAETSAEIRVEAGQPTDVPHREMAEDAATNVALVQTNALMRHLKWFLLVALAAFVVIYLVVRHT
jgi:hypothetical protein